MRAPRRVSDLGSAFGKSPPLEADLQGRRPIIRHRTRSMAQNAANPAPGEVIDILGDPISWAIVSKIVLRLPEWIDDHVVRERGDLPREETSGEERLKDLNPLLRLLGIVDRVCHVPAGTAKECLDRVSITFEGRVLEVERSVASGRCRPVFSLRRPLPRFERLEVLRDGNCLDWASLGWARSAGNDQLC